MKSRSLRAAPIFNKVATAKAQEYSMGIKEQAAQRKKQTKEPIEPGLLEGMNGNDAARGWR
jgi:hypothetical protein